MKLNLTLSEKQFNTIVSALDFYSRIQAGQFDEFRTLNKMFLDKFDDIEENLNKIKREVFGLDSRTSLGICSDELSLSAKRAYEIRKWLEYTYSWKKHPEGGLTVNFDEPLDITGEGMDVKIELEDK